MQSIREQQQHSWHGEKSFSDVELQHINEHGEHTDALLTVDLSLCILVTADDPDITDTSHAAIGEPQSSTACEAAGDPTRNSMERSDGEFRGRGNLLSLCVELTVGVVNLVVALFIFVVTLID